MNKLTIKEIAPYLPYGIKVFDQWDESDNGEFLDVHGFDGEHQEWLIYDNMDGSHAVICKSLVKMLLRPLSYLTKEIEHNGIKFIPINELKHFYGFDYMWSYVCCKQGDFNPGAVCLASINKLLEWHFDIFGLIDKGLAVDINNLNK